MRLKQSSGGLSRTQSNTPGFDYQDIAAGINVYNAQTTDGGLPQDDLFFNNLAIVPEPSTFVFLMLGAPLLARRMRRNLMN